MSLLSYAVPPRDLEKHQFHIAPNARLIGKTGQAESSCIGWVRSSGSYCISSRLTHISHNEPLDVYEDNPARRHSLTTLCMHHVKVPARSKEVGDLL